MASKRNDGGLHRPDGGRANFRGTGRKSKLQPTMLEEVAGGQRLVSSGGNATPGDRPRRGKHQRHPPRNLAARACHSAVLVHLAATAPRASSQQSLAGGNCMAGGGDAVICCGHLPAHRRCSDRSPVRRSVLERRPGRWCWPVCPQSTTIHSTAAPTTGPRRTTVLPYHALPLQCLQYRTVLASSQPDRHISRLLFPLRQSHTHSGRSRSFISSLSRVGVALLASKNHILSRSFLCSWMDTGPVRRCAPLLLLAHLAPGRSVKLTAIHRPPSPLRGHHVELHPLLSSVQIQALASHRIGFTERRVRWHHQTQHSQKRPDRPRSIRSGLRHLSHCAGEASPASRRRLWLFLPSAPPSRRLTQSAPIAALRHPCSSCKSL